MNAKQAFTTISTRQRFGWSLQQVCLGPDVKPSTFYKKIDGHRSNVCVEERTCTCTCTEKER